MRIVGGKFRGRSLATPKDQSIRPTSDRARESLFNILEHRFGEDLADAAVLDLFAGTGALGLEALSRGARTCLFVEQAADARALIRQNIEALGLTGATRIFRRDASKLGSAGTRGPYSLVFLDPPYGRGLGEQALASAREGGWLCDTALCILEEQSGIEISPPAGFSELESRTYGAGKLTFVRRSG